MIEKGEMDLLRKYVSGYNLLLALGAFYMGTSILLSEGIFGEFPPEWTGRMPFNSWESLALFGIVVFGVGNAAIAVMGFVKNTKPVFWLTAMMGALLFAASVMPAVLVGEWYLPTVQLLAIGILQLALGLFGGLREQLKRTQQLTKQL